MDFALTDDDFDTSFGLPRPRWEGIHRRVFAEPDLAQRHQQWCAAQREWLRRLREGLQQPYQVNESEHFIILTAARGDVGWLADYAEQARRQVTDLLGERVGERVGKLAVLIFAGEAEYRRYTRHFLPEGKPTPSAGAWINDGDAHIIMDGITGFKATLVHELVHSQLSVPPRPRWLEEGLARHLERRLVTHQRRERSTLVRQELRSHWKPKTLQGFWFGEAFADARPYGGQPYAYELADLLVTELAELSEADLRRFAAAARRDDAGVAASREVYGFGLEVWAGKVLGEGEWAPRVPPPVEPPGGAVPELP